MKNISEEKTRGLLRLEEKLKIGHFKKKLSHITDTFEKIFSRRNSLDVQPPIFVPFEKEQIYLQDFAYLANK